MTDYLHIENGMISFTAVPVEKIGIAAYCESFQIKIEEVKIIAISPRLKIDDEFFLITLINARGQFFPIPDQVLSLETAGKLEKTFGLNPVRKVEWARFKYNDHQAKYDKIIFPRDLYWEDLFKKDLLWYWRRIVNLGCDKYLYGNFTEKVKAFLNASLHKMQ